MEKVWKKENSLALGGIVSLYILYGEQYGGSSKN